MSTVHDYLSTACWHELNDGRPTLHAQCRATCKFAEGEPEYCSCPNHPEQDNAPAPLPWVDQARSVAVRLLAALGGPGGLAEADPALYREYRTDPGWFWLRGEVQPPGEWRPASDDSTG